MQRCLAPPKHPSCTQLCSRKDTGLSAAAGRSQEGRLRRVGLPFRSPSLACTAIKRTKSRWEQSAIVSPSSPLRRADFRERPVAEPRLKLLGSGFPTFVATAFPSPYVNFFFPSVYGYFSSIYVCAPHVSEEARGGHLIPRAWSYRHSWAIAWVLGMESGFAGRAVGVLSPWIVFVAVVLFNWKMCLIRDNNSVIIHLKIQAT